MLVLLIVTPPYALGMILCFPLPHRARRYTAVPWVFLTIWLIKHVLGIDYRVLGRENIPQRPAVILSKHQSAWETIAFQQIFPPLSFVLKKNLLRIPFFGWGLALFSPIAIDRSAGREALKQLEHQGRERLDAGFWVLVFPEGTRMAVGEKGNYQIGGAWLAARCGVPVVPVAHNAGRCWPKNSFIKRPGEISVVIGPAISTQGRRPAQILAECEAWIEATMLRL